MNIITLLSTILGFATDANGKVSSKRLGFMTFLTMGMIMVEDGGSNNNLYLFFGGITSLVLGLACLWLTKYEGLSGEIVGNVKGLAETMVEYVNQGKVIHEELKKNKLDLEAVKGVHAEVKDSIVKELEKLSIKLPEAIEGIGKKRVIKGKKPAQPEGK